MSPTTPSYASTEAEAAEQVIRAGRPDIASLARQVFRMALSDPRAYCDLRPEPGTPEHDVLTIVHPAHPAVSGRGFFEPVMT